MAQSSKEWNDYEMARDDWEKALIDLERCRAAESNARWELNEKARILEDKNPYPPHSQIPQSATKTGDPQ